MIYSILASICWSVLMMAEILIAKVDPLVAQFIKFILFGLVGIIFFIGFKKKIKNSLSKIMNDNKHILLYFILCVLLIAPLANYFYFNAHSVSGSNSHIVIIMLLFSLIGAQPYSLSNPFRIARIDLFPSYGIGNKVSLQ